MNNIETRILDYGKKLDINLQNISKQIEEMQKLINDLPSNVKLINDYSNEDDEDDLYSIWIEFPFTESE